MNNDEYSITYYYGEKKGTTVAVLKVNATGEIFKGISHCNDSDIFSQEVGEKLAESRAMKKYFKSLWEEAQANYEHALEIVKITEKIAQKKYNRFAREAKWLANFEKTV